MEISGFLVVFLSQDSNTARTSGLAECAKAVNKTNLGRRLLMLTCNHCDISHLKIGLLNVRYLTYKAVFVNELITDYNLDVIGLTETWLKPD
jgi:hypothetical protein